MSENKINGSCSGITDFHNGFGVGGVESSEESYLFGSTRGFNCRNGYQSHSSYSLGNNFQYRHSLNGCNGHRPLSCDTSEDPIANGVHFRHSVGHSGQYGYRSSSANTGHCSSTQNPGAQNLFDGLPSPNTETCKDKNSFQLQNRPMSFQTNLDSSGIHKRNSGVSSIGRNGFRPNSLEVHADKSKAHYSSSGALSTQNGFLTSSLESASDSSEIPYRSSTGLLNGRNGYRPASTGVYCSSLWESKIQEIMVRHYKCL